MLAQMNYQTDVDVYHELNRALPEQISVELGTKLEIVERIVILNTLKAQAYNRTRTAKILGIGIRTLQRKLKCYGAEGIGLKNHQNLQLA